MTETCEDCGDAIPDGEGCRCDGHVYCGACFVHNCPACAADLRDQMAAEAASEGIHV